MLLIEDVIYIATYVYNLVENYCLIILIMQFSLVLIILIHSSSPDMVILSPSP